MQHKARSIAAVLLGLSLALAHACTTETGVYDGNMPPPVGGNGAVDSGHADSGPDAGDAGLDGGPADAGTLDGGPLDAGPCVGSLGRPMLVAAKDECFTGGALRAPTLIDTDCSAVLLLDGVPTCAGHLGGPLNAFTGTCGPGALPCSSPSIAGTLRCQLPDAGGTCAIILCDSSSDGGCGP